MTMTRLQFNILGQVQGVGFRPHVYRVAKKLQLTGFVFNHAAGVHIEVQGSKVEKFKSLLLSNLPPLAIIQSIDAEIISPLDNESDFFIHQSRSGEIGTMISPDVSICDDCLSELFDKNNRYYQYPFLNCTNCGPRFTITNNLPYDRAQTTMADFSLCAQCKKNFTDPTDRRYHAQPTACKQCGPALSQSIETIAKAVSEGKIVALKGMGGYQLICDARNENAVKSLRQRKQRDAKPFALMVENSELVKSFVFVDDNENKLLNSKERPIVFLKKKFDLLPEAVAPGLSHYGLMLPSTPLQYLLFHILKDAVLVVTSANISGEPLIINDDDAKEKLSSIADFIVSYNRNINTRVDDSVMRIVNQKPLFIRRARGYVPTPIQLPYELPCTLALGAQLKNTFCITRGDQAFVSQHIGTLNNKATIDYFHETISHFMKLLSVKPECVVHDKHPNYYTTQYAQSLRLPIYSVQHHHAHAAAILAEYNLKEPALALILDGVGYGDDSAPWGGELLLLDKLTYKRLGHLDNIPLPGGDSAAKEPWRVASGVLSVLNKHCEIEKRYFKFSNSKYISHMIENNINSPWSSSCGRLFDAASSLLGVCDVSQYEGQAAMQLEALVTNLVVLKKGWEIERNCLKLFPVLDALCDLSAVAGANLFHGTLIAALTDWVIANCKKQKINTVLLSGGCFLNKILSEGMYDQLTQHGINVYLPHQLPPNDASISLGQAWIGGQRYQQENLCV